MAKRFVVTGGAGFVGTNLCEHLVREGHEVVVVDDLCAGKRERLPEGVTFHQFDVCDTKALTEAAKGADTIFHLAALPRVQFSIDEPFAAQRVNVDGTLSVLEAARAVGARVVFAASSAAYGDQETLPLSEDLPAEPKSPYALHKYMGEEMLKLWHRLHGLRTVSLRFFNIYGPHMDPEGPYALVIGRFLLLRSEGKPLTITGDGEQTRDFIHVHDVVRALVAASESDALGQGEVFNVGSGKDMSINRIAELIGGPVEYVPPRIEPRHTRADITSIKRMIGWEPTLDVEAGVEALKKEMRII